MFNALRITLITILTLIATSNIASAGDAALKRILGFSPDGKYFAFEQYGIQDGSGFPYADIFFINTQNNTWVEDPIRIFIKDDTVSITKVRALAIAKATPIVKRLNTTLHGFTLVSNPITQLDRKKYSAHFGIHPSAPTIDQYSIDLIVKDAPNPKCQTYSGKNPKLFSLHLVKMPAQTPVATYNDTNIPTSRNCPIDYSISDVHYFEAENQDTVFMTFINISAQSFEGPNRRFMVIPFYIKKQN